MPIRVRTPDGGTATFPDGTPDAEIERVMRSEYPPEQQRQQQATPAAPNAAEGQAIVRSRAARASSRAAVPMGLGFLTEPIAAMLADPRQRSALGNNARGAVDAVRTQHVDLPQLGRDTMGVGQRAMANLPNLPGQILSHAPQIAYGMTAQPFVENDQNRDTELLANMRGDSAGADEAAGQAVGNVGGMATNTLGAVAGPLVRTPLQAAGLAAGLTAPNSLASGQGSLQERLPQAIVDTGGAAMLGAGAQAGGNALSRRLQVPTRAGNMVAAMDQAGVDPSLAAANAGTFGGVMSGAMTNAIADNPVAGMAVRPRIGRQLEQAAAESRRIQGGYGQTLSPEAAGAAVQRGVRRYASDRTAPNPRPGADPRTVLTSEWSVPAQAEAIYDHVLRPVEGNPTTLSNTVRAIRGIEALGDNDPVVATFRADPVLRDITSAAHEIYTRPNQPFTLRAARELRRRLRIQMDAPQLAGGQDAASLRQVYNALTEDIYAGAGAAANDLRAADRFYARHMERIHERLHAFDPNAATPSQTFQSVLRAADAKTGNTRALQALRSSLRGGEWRTLGASLIDHMGTPTSGAGGTAAAELGFSVNTFSTAWNRMSPLARRILFGSSNSTLARDLDNLATVVGQLKGVERTTNASGSGRYANIALTAGGAVANMPATAASLAGLGVTGEMLTNPAFVRWLTSASRTPASAGGARQMLANLARIASTDPAVLPVYNRLAASQRAPAPDQQEQLQPSLQ